MLLSEQNKKHFAKILLLYQVLWFIGLIYILKENFFLLEFRHPSHSVYGHIENARQSKIGGPLVISLDGDVTKYYLFLPDSITDDLKKNLIVGDEVSGNVTYKQLGRSYFTSINLCGYKFSTSVIDSIVVPYRNHKLSGTGAMGIIFMLSFLIYPLLALPQKTKSPKVLIHNSVNP